MRRTIWLVIVLALAFVAVATPARAQNPNPNCTGLTFEEAQEILAQDASDPRGLDLDDDGVACEASPRSGTGAQEATPGALVGHPLVGAWVVDTEAENPANAPSVTTIGADGIAIDVTADGASAGVWEATGPRTATLTLAGVFEEEGFGGNFFIRAEIEVDAAGEAFESPYTFTVVAADGTVLETGQDTARGTRLRVPAAEAVGTPLAGFPTWTPATPEAGGPEEATPAA